jgi:hypothetical protein
MARTGSVAAVTREDILCGQCQEATASIFCYECRERFCPACSSNVHQRGRLREHTLLPYQPGDLDSNGYFGAAVGTAEVPSGILQRSKSPVVGGSYVCCPKHPEEFLQFFCLQCECECICAECAVHGDHRGHEVLNVRHAYTSMSGRIAEALNKAKARADEQQIADQEARRQLKEVELVIEQGRQAMQDAFRNMRASLAQKEAQLLRDVDETAREAVVQLESKTDSIDGHVRTINCCQEQLRTLDMGDDEVRALNGYAKIRAQILTVLGPLNGIDDGSQNDLEDLKQNVQRVFDAQIEAVSVLSSHVTDIRRTDTLSQ